MKWLAAACLSSICFCAAAGGTLVPLTSAGDVRYLFAWAGGWTLLAESAAAVALLGAAYWSVAVRARGAEPPKAAAARSGAWLAPASALGIIALGILPAVPGVGERAAPLGYFFFDLRWWWLAGLALWAARSAHRLIGRRDLRRAARWPIRPRSRLLDTTLFAGVILWAVATSPHVRFTGDLSGDEPKYLRYCELWYQGGGLAIDQERPFADRPPAVHRTAGLFVRAVAEETRELVSDLRRFAAAPRTFRWNRATADPGAYFVRGKHGGIYQLHQPGLAVVLFPGYTLDRYLFGSHPGPTGEFPAALPATYATLLLLYGACAVALFRLLRRALPRDGSVDAWRSELIACGWAALAMITLPAGAFAFQIYPEILAALLVVLVAGYVLFRSGTSHVAAAVAAGAAAGFLAWLHLRFLPLSICLAAAGLLRTRGRARRAFAIGYVALLSSIGAYVYRATGSWLPNALWDAGEFGLNTTAVPLNLAGYFVDRVWGLLPHAPILAAAVPGLVLLWRRAPASAGLVIAAVLALAIPAAGHTLSAAGSSPDRLIAASVPLLIWPTAELARRAWRLSTVRALMIVVAVLSLDAAVSYNAHHSKSYGPMRDASASGWKPNLAFPTVRDVFDPSRNDRTLLFVVLAAAAAAVAATWWSTRRGMPDATEGTDAGSHGAHGSPELRDARDMAIQGAAANAGVTGSGVVGPRPGLAFAAVTTLIVAASFVATAATRRWIHDDYLPDEPSAQRAAAGALVALDRCRVCFTSQQGAIDWRALEPNPAREVRLGVRVAGRTAHVEATVEPAQRLAGFGRILVEPGDGTAASWAGIVGSRGFDHRYARAGTYTVIAWLQLAGGGVASARQTVVVEAQKE